MAPSQSSTPSTDNGINPTAFTTLSDNKSRTNSFGSAPSFNATSLSGSAREMASSGHPYSPNSRIGIPCVSAVRGDTPSDYHGDIHQNDIVIAVMGLTGAGKSSFVNHVAGKAVVEIGYDLKSQTRKVQPVRCTRPDDRRNIVLVDTPGFDDTHLTDVRVLRIIATWLQETYKGSIKLAGLLYLHRISDVRLAGTSLKNLTVFQDLCGNNNLKNVILVTTMWDEVEEPLGNKREQELVSNFWEDMLRLGSRTCRFQGTPSSAWEIIGRLDLEGSRKGQAPLKIQQEMVDRQLPFEKTTAAKTLLRSLLEEMKGFWAWLRIGTRRVLGVKKHSENLRRHILSRTSTRRSNPSETSLAVSLPSDTSNNPSPTERPSTGCNINGRRDSLLATVTALGLGYQVAEITATSIPALRGAIGAVLQIAQLIEEMGGTHHAITRAIEYAGWLLKEITQLAAESKLSGGMEESLNSFTRELNQLKDVVTTISNRDHTARFFLDDADIQAVATCTDSIRAIYDMIEVKLTIDNRRVIAGLENELRELRNTIELRQCRCGMSVFREESREPENGQHSSTTGGS